MSKNIKVRDKGELRCLFIAKEEMLDGDVCIKSIEAMQGNTVNDMGDTNSLGLDAVLSAITISGNDVDAYRVALGSTQSGLLQPNTPYYRCDFQLISENEGCLTLFVTFYGNGDTSCCVVSVELDRHFCLELRLPRQGVLIGSVLQDGLALYYKPEEYFTNMLTMCVLTGDLPAFERRLNEPKLTDEELCLLLLDTEYFKSIKTPYLVFTSELLIDETTVRIQYPVKGKGETQRGYNELCCQVTSGDIELLREISNDQLPFMLAYDSVSENVGLYF